MRAIRYLLLLSLLACSLAQAGPWKRWPVDADEFATTIDYPEDFVPMRARPTTIAADRKVAPLLLGARFRSPDGMAEFAVSVFSVRHAPTAPGERRITTPLQRKEVAGGRKIRRKKIDGEQGAYWLHDEETTVLGNGTTRYLLNAFSTGTLPGASSVLWEFQVADEAARKRWAGTYRRFKESLEVAED